MRCASRCPGMMLADQTNVMDFLHSPYHFNAWQRAIPTTLTGVGIIGLESDWLKYQNHKTRDKLQENIDTRIITIDNFSQYAPMTAAYALNVLGVKGKHGYGDLTIILGTGFFCMYNNRHWLTDSIAGAGVGILSTEAAYWLYPFISKTLFRKRYLKNTFISPYVSQEGKGVVCSITF